MAGSNYYQGKERERLFELFLRYGLFCLLRFCTNTCFPCMVVLGLGWSVYTGGWGWRINVQWRTKKYDYFCTTDIVWLGIVHGVPRILYIYREIQWLLCSIFTSVMIWLESCIWQVHRGLLWNIIYLAESTRRCALRSAIKSMVLRITKFIMEGEACCSWFQLDNLTGLNMMLTGFIAYDLLMDLW